MIYLSHKLTFLGENKNTRKSLINLRSYITYLKLYIIRISEHLKAQAIVNCFEVSSSCFNISSKLSCLYLICHIINQQMDNSLITEQVMFASKGDCVELFASAGDFGTSVGD